MVWFPWLLLTLAAPGDRGGIAWKAGFGQDPLWSDGNAEVSVYDARDVKYEIPRASKTILIVVAEDLLPEKLVKADNPGRAGKTLRVLKLNHVRSIPTGVYVYQQMMSAFLTSDRLAAVKLTVASLEWCGNSFVEWRSDRPLLSIRTYFETPADTDTPLEVGDAVFYDSLPLKLRGLDFERTREGSLRIVESVFSAHPLPPVVEEARLSLSRTDGAPLLYRVTVSRREKRDVLDFEAAFPHRLVRWDRGDGGSLRLMQSRRFRYWEKNAPGDERLLSPAATR